MLSVLFATEACYTIKENNKEKSFCWGKLPFYWRKLPFCWQKLRKSYFVLAFFFADPNYHFPDANWEKPIIQQHFITEAKKTWITRVVTILVLIEMVFMTIWEMFHWRISLNSVLLLLLLNFVSGGFRLELKMVKKVIINLDHLSKALGPEWLSVVVLKNYEPELSYMLA